jgi:hypothetical protein|tara:strand:+ start:253 stop:384 length:132 start_codon:yes stop_codon:yes gene_type:complete
LLYINEEKIVETIKMINIKKDKERRKILETLIFGKMLSINQHY